MQTNLGHGCIALAVWRDHGKEIQQLYLWFPQCLELVSPAAEYHHKPAVLRLLSEDGVPKQKEQIWLLHFLFLCPKKKINVHYTFLKKETSIMWTFSNKEEYL